MATGIFGKNKRICLLYTSSRRAPAVIIARNIEPMPELVESAKKYAIPLLRSGDATSRIVASLVAYLSVELAPRVTRHGVLVEVYGEGMLIIGDSGVGKSETAIELVKRGHRLIADDAVEIKRVSNKTLVGSAPPNIRHFIELRGIGIITVSYTHLKQQKNAAPSPPVKLKENLQENLVKSRQDFDGTNDLVVRRFLLEGNQAVLICMEGMVNIQVVAQGILNPILNSNPNTAVPKEQFAFLRDQVLALSLIHI